MSLEGFVLLCLLALQVQGKHISNNSTRVTTGRIWAMAHEGNDISNKIFSTLRNYALSCCNDIDGIDYCENRQLAYWAFIPHIYWFNENQIMLWLHTYFNPDKPGADKTNMCRGELAPYPYFAIARGGAGGQHTEAFLLEGPMSEVALQQTANDVPTDFFLYTFNSPCCFFDNNNCQQKIFDFADNWMPYHHRLTVGFTQWYMYPEGATMDDVREDFCERVQEYKNSDDYNSDFFNSLFFKKIDEQAGDTEFEEDIDNMYC